MTAARTSASSAARPPYSRAWRIVRVVIVAAASIVGGLIAVAWLLATMGGERR